MQPMLATRSANKDGLPRGKDWSYEVKWDGVRVIADTTRGELRRARSGREVTTAYPELAGLGALQGAVLDGEVVVMAGSTPSFEALAERMHVRDAARARRLATRAPATFVVFDLLALYGVDITWRPLDERRATLAGLALPERVQLSPVYPDLDDLWAVTLEHGLEGVMAKRRSSTYQPGRRSPDWVKAAHRSTRVAAVVGWLPEGAADAGRGAVGNARPGSPLDEPVPAADARHVTWCEPVVTVDVAYLQRTARGRLRQPTIRAPRTDVPVDPWETP